MLPNKYLLAMPNCVSIQNGHFYSSRLVSALALEFSTLERKRAEVVKNRHKMSVRLIPLNLGLENQDISEAIVAELEAQPSLAPTTTSSSSTHPPSSVSELEASVAKLYAIVNAQAAALSDKNSFNSH